MKIQFAHTEINEYAVANLVFKNDGKAFDVDEVLGRELLFVEHSLDGTTMVKVFELAGAGKQPADDAGDADTPETLAKLPRKDLEAMAKDAGLDGDGYTNKLELATAILAAKGE